MCPWAIVWWVLIAASVAGAQTPATKPATQAADPVAEWLRKIPASLSGNADIGSFDVTGETRVMLPMRFRVVRDETGQGLLVVTSLDGVPLLVGINGEAIIYDALAGVVRRAKDVRPVMHFNATADNVNINAGVAWSQKKPNDVEAAIDLRSLVQFSSQQPRFEPDGLMTRLIGQTKAGSVSVFTLDPAAEMPLVAMETQIKGAIALRLSSIRVNEPVNADFTLPDDAAIEKLLPAKTYEKGFIDRTALSLAFIRSMSFRVALDNPDLRPALEKVTGKIDWEARKAHDRAMVEPLKGLFGDRIAPREGK